jgi:3,4-dihydroxy 2-butanone 4-phosphate synthase/GTP cyclohydrolase II
MTAVDSLGKPVDEVSSRRDGGSVLRSYGTGSQILRDLGVTRMRVMSAPKQMHAISGFGLEIVEYIERSE